MEQFREAGHVVGGELIQVHIDGDTFQDVVFHVGQKFDFAYAHFPLLGPPLLGADASSDVDGVALRHVSAPSGPFIAKEWHLAGAAEVLNTHDAVGVASFGLPPLDRCHDAAESDVLIKAF